MSITLDPPVRREDLRLIAASFCRQIERNAERFVEPDDFPIAERFPMLQPWVPDAEAIDGEPE